uniref:Uncharacterized protein n=1 Tax=Plectus sambesii TaxID=2011161 RepID=A0A914VA30_9BILA
MVTATTAAAAAAAGRRSPVVAGLQRCDRAPPRPSAVVVGGSVIVYLPPSPTKPTVRCGRRRSCGQLESAHCCGGRRQWLRRWSKLADWKKVERRSCARECEIGAGDWSRRRRDQGRCVCSTVGACERERRRPVLYAGRTLRLSNRVGAAHCQNMFAPDVCWSTRRFRCCSRRPAGCAARVRVRASFARILDTVLEVLVRRIRASFGLFRYACAPRVTALSSNDCLSMHSIPAGSIA